jgi:hypothetical protein
MVDLQRIREKVEYVEPLTKQIENRIIAGTEDLFCTPNELEDLHVTVRIACEFHKFLTDYSIDPPAGEAEYVVDTIRAGIDQFYLLAYSCKCMSEDYVAWSFDKQVIAGFSELRDACLRRFADLCRPDAKASQMLASLLAFVHLELLFVAQRFPFLLTEAPKN